MTLTLVAVLVLLFLLIQIPYFYFTVPGPDHFYYLAIIRNIRNKGHRLILTLSSIIGETYFSFPQFFYWFLSYLPDAFLQKRYRLLGISINVVLVTVMYFFTQYLATEGYINLGVAAEYAPALACMFFILNPINYVTWNSKNSGLSGRGFGLLMGIGFLFSYVLFYCNQQWLFLGITWFFAYLVIRSSVFAFQFLLFYTIIGSILLKDGWLALSPVTGSALFLLTNFKVARNFFIAQYWHKHIFSKYLSKIMLFTYRKSIWRDFVYDFWMKLRSNEPFFKKVTYIIYNPVVSLLLFIPTLTWLLVYVATHAGTIFTAEFLPAEKVLLLSVATALISFLLTSFRPTRFLGEPERYVEFITPLAIILFLSARFYEPSIAIVVAVISVLFTCFFIYGMVKQYRINTAAPHSNINLFGKVEAFIMQDSASNKTMICNDLLFATYFLPGPLRVVHPSIVYPYTGSFHIKDIYPKQFGIIKPDLVLPFVKEFKLGYVVLNTQMGTDYAEVMNSDRLTHLHTEQQFALYRVKEG
jgi:hypothetical protein